MSTQCCQGCGPEHGWENTCEDLEQLSTYYDSNTPEVIADRQERLLDFWAHAQERGGLPIPEGILAQLGSRVS